MSEDHELLRSYVSSRSESAFAELVSTHLDFVYATALRMVAGDSHLAQDVAQSVFIDLNRKASSLLHLRSFEAWLYQATRYAAAKAVRTEQRRSVREQAALEMELDSNQATAAESSNDWERIAPVLDEAIEQLATDDREAILLRFFARKNFRAVAESIGTTEEAARKRVSRALEKLRTHLSRSGVSISETSLIASLATGAAAGAPPALATTVTTAALAAPFALGGTATLFHIMTTAQTKVAIAVASLSLAAIPLLVQQKTISTVKEENQKLTEQLHAAQAALEAETARTNAPSRSVPEHLELMRLRAEVTLLKQQERDRETLASAKASPQAEERQPNRADFLPSESWQNVGFDTPAKAFQSFLAALKSESAEIDSLVHWEIDWKEKPTDEDIALVEKSRLDYIEMLRRAPRKISGFNLAPPSQDGSDQARVHFQTLTTNGNAVFSRLEMRNTEGEWKPVIRMGWTKFGNSYDFATSPIFGRWIDLQE